MMARIHWLGIVTLALLVWSPSLAEASGLQSQSPLHGAFEFKLGLASPDLDAEFGGDGPFDEMYGSRRMFHFELEVDGYFWQEFGSLGAYGAIGHATMRAKAFNSDGTRNVTDTSRLRLLPLRAGVVYRFDELVDRYRVPLAVSLKAGFDWYLWWVQSSNGVADHRPAEGGARTVGRGGTTGWHVSAGLHFLLDSLAPRMAQSFDNNSGINSTYLFAELLLTQVNDFGGASSWDLSDTQLLFGLAFEF